MGVIRSARSMLWIHQRFTLPEHLRIREEEQQVTREPVPTATVPTAARSIIKPGCSGDDSARGWNQTYFAVSSNKAPNIREEGIPMWHLVQ